MTWEYYWFYLTQFTFLKTFVTMSAHPLIREILWKSDVCVFIFTVDNRVFEHGAWFLLPAENM